MIFAESPGPGNLKFVKAEDVAELNGLAHVDNRLNGKDRITIWRAQLSEFVQRYNKNS